MHQVMTKAGSSTTLCKWNFQSGFAIHGVSKCHSRRRWHSNNTLLLNFLPLFKTSNRVNYSNEVLLMLYQLEFTMAPRQAQQLMWSRTIIIPLDFPVTIYHVIYTWIGCVKMWSEVWELTKWMGQLFELASARVHYRRFLCSLMKVTVLEQIQGLTQLQTLIRTKA